MSTKNVTEPTQVRRTLFYYWQTLKKHSVALVVGFFASIYQLSVRDFIIPYLLAAVIDYVGLHPGDTFATIWSDLRGMVILCAVLIISILVMWPLRLITIWHTEIVAMRSLAKRCFTALTRHSMSFHNNKFGGSLVSQSNKFVASIERFVDTFMFNLLPLLINILCTVIILWPKAPYFVLGLLTFVFVYAVFTVISFNKISYLNEDEAQKYSKQSGQLADSITNMMAVKGYGQEKHELTRYEKVTADTANASLALMKAIMSRDIVNTILVNSVLIMLLIFLMGGQEWFGLSVATMILIVMYSRNVLSQIYEINNILRSFNRVFGDAAEMTVILDTPQAVTDKDKAKKLVIKKSSVDFVDVDFAHPEQKDGFLRGFTLHIPAGQTVGLVGISGSGKTTLTKLILRFMDVDSGKILIDGQNVADVTQESLHQNIAYVPQETTLFHRSIGENIAYGKLNASKKEIINAAKLANAWEFIEKLPEGLETLVGERGVKLSGGQRQRVAIARAILKDAPLLVLDEATSALDSESEKLIQDALKKLMKNRTCLVIAHRLSTVADLDRIIVLENGKIVEDDKHSALVKKGGAYAKLWQRQSGAFLE